MIDQHLFGKLQNRHSLIPIDGWKVVEEGVERLASLKIVEQRLYRDPRADENRGSPENLGIRMDDGGFAHGSPLTLKDTATLRSAILRLRKAAGANGLAALQAARMGCPFSQGIGLRPQPRAPF